MWRQINSKLRSCKKVLGFGAERVTPASFHTIREKTLAERIGFGPDARLVIVHADDLGLAPAVNAAFIAGVARGLINSGSVMVPCRGFSEIVSFAKKHRHADVGLHLTLTSDQSHGWAPVAPSSQVSSLTDTDGFLHRKWSPDRLINLEEVEIELRAQIEKALASGLRPTHFDSHEHVLQLRGHDLFGIYLRLGREYNVPVLVARSWFAGYPYLRLSLNERDIVLDRTVIINSSVKPENWSAFYRHAIQTLPPGVTEIIIHPGYDNDELRALFPARSAWGAAWRQRDFDFFSSDEFSDQLAKCDVKLITWREICEATRLVLQ